MADKIYKLIFTKDDGTEEEVQFTAPQGPQGEPGEDGSDGRDGYTPVKGVDYFDGLPGADGADGKTPYIQDGYWYIDGVNTNVKAQGDNGVGISKVEKTATSGKVDTYTITFTNGNTSTYTITNGNDGKDGEDYVITDADKTEIADRVIAYFGGKPISGYVDENKHITLNTDSLADGTYTIELVMADGSTIELDAFVVGEGSNEPDAPTITSISASKTTTSYTVGDTLNTNDITVTATYSDGSTKTITDFTVDSSAVQMGTAGTYSLVVSYGGVNTTISIKVVEKTPSDFANYNATNEGEAYWDYWVNKARIGSDGKYRSSSVSADYGTPGVSPWIEVKQGDVIKYTGMYTSSLSSGLYKTDKSLIAAGVLSSLAGITIQEACTFATYSGQFVITNASAGLLRIGGHVDTNKGTPVINIQRDGKWL